METAKNAISHRKHGKSSRRHDDEDSEYDTYDEKKKRTKGMEKHIDSSKKRKTSDSDSRSEKKNTINLKKHEKNRRHDSEDSDYDFDDEKNVKKGMEHSKLSRSYVTYEFGSDSEKKSRKLSAAHESHHVRPRKVAEEKTHSNRRMRRMYDTNDESSDTDGGKETIGIQVMKYSKSKKKQDSVTDN